MKDRWMRAEAETSNVRARGRREADDARQYAVQKFATDIVEAAENLKRGIDALPPPASGEPEILVKVREGLAGIERNFTGVLERNGIQKADPVGQPFDPNLHQAMAEQESELHPPGTVMQAWTASWTLHGRLLKPAMVVVAKAPTAELTGSGARPPTPGMPASGAKLDTTA
jgi:molecular chaperone GrpE